MKTYMRIKKPIALTITFFLSALITFLIMFRFDISPKDYIYSLELKKILKSNEYESLDGVKIYSSVNDKRNAEIIDELERLNDELAILLGPVKKTDLTILVFEELEEIEKLSRSENVVAFYDYKHNVIALVMSFSNEDLGHEYTHYYLHYYLNKNKITDIPAWFEEGLAEYVAVTMNDGKAIIPSGEVINFRLLKGKNAWNRYSQKSTQPYIQSHYALEYIVRNNDQAIIKKIIDDSAELNFSKSFYKHTGIEVKELHKLIN